MTSPSYELQVAVVTRLKADPATIAIAGARIYDTVPSEAQRTAATGAAWPYVSLGPSDENSDDAECITGFEISFQIDCWSRAPGFPEVRRLADAVRIALHDYEFALPVNALAQLEHRQTRFFRDPDGLTSHAAMTFAAFIEAA